MSKNTQVESGTYQSQPVAAATGRGLISPNQLEQALIRSSPNRWQGESESRLHTLLPIDGLESRSATSELLRRSLKDAEYFNRKLQLISANGDYDGNVLSNATDGSPHQLPRFIFEPDTILHRALSEVNVRLRLPYKECLFVHMQSERVMVGSFDVYAIELSDTKFFFMYSLNGLPFNVQVNQFRSKDHDGKIQYKAWLAEGPDQRLDAADKKHLLEDVAFSSIAPVIAFLEGLSQGMYTLEREGVQVPPSQVPPPAKEGIEFKVRSLHPNRPSTKSVPLGGTHASPREHARRGYWRRSASGKHVWIGPVIVNKGKTPGKIIKDYQIMDPTQ